MLLASAATLQLYVANYTSTYRAIPLSVALATAWAAGHRRWPLLIAAWFVIGPLGYALSQLPAEETRTPLTLLGDVLSNAAMFAAVLVLGEAVRSRRALDRQHRLLLAEQERSERLLLNVLPAPIAERLKQGEGVIADAFPEVTVLFADIVDFTRRSQQIAPEQVVQALNDLFSAFDRLAQRHGLEKIKTVGDAFMVAGGLPDPRPNHAQAVAEMALAIRDEVASRVDPSGQPLAVRIGMDTRPGGGRGYRDQQVQLRLVGRHREHGQPHGIPWSARVHPGDGANIRAPQRRIRLRATGIDSRQGEGQGPGVLSECPFMRG